MPSREGDRLSERAFEAILAATHAAFAAAKPGVSGGAVDAASRSACLAAGFEQFPHHTGHGTGFRYHESRPQIVPGSDHVIASGHVIATEPGYYADGLGGFRHEDNAVVTESGANVLATTFYGLDDKAPERGERLPVAVHDRAAVDVQGLARYVTRRRGPEEIDGPCDLFGDGQSVASGISLVTCDSSSNPEAIVPSILLVIVYPGATALMRIPRRPTPRRGHASDPRLPALAALYDSRFGMPTLAAIDEMLTIAAAATPSARDKRRDSNGRSRPGGRRGGPTTIRR